MSQKHSVNLDILRGFAAIIVLIVHLNGSVDFDKYFGQKISVYYNMPGHLAVLVFFILSGFVIGLNTPKLNNSAQIKEYIMKRVVRLFPLYAFAIILTLCTQLYSWQVILSNLFFISVPLGNVMGNAFPLWSLHFEVVFYITYIFISYFNISLSLLVKLLITTSVLLFAFFHNKPVNPLMVSYIIGLLFWITGAWLSKIKNWPVWNISGSRIASIFLLMFCLQNLSIYGPLLKTLNIPTYIYHDPPYHWYQQRIMYLNLFFYPFTLVLIMSLIRVYHKINNYLVYFFFIASLLRVIMLWKVYSLKYIVEQHYVIPITFLFTSIILWGLNFDFKPLALKAIKSTAFFSNISYAVYILHLPLIFVFGNIVTTSVPGFLIKLFAYLATLYIVSYIMELKVQPIIKNFFIRKKTRLVESPIKLNN